MNHCYIALAQATPGGASPAQGLWSTLSMMAIIFAIFYFLLIRPQQKQAKQHKEMLAGLQRGAQVVLSSGIHGRIHEVAESTFTVEIADKVRVKVNRDSVSKIVDATVQTEASTGKSSASKKK